MQRKSKSQKVNVAKYLTPLNNFPDNLNDFFLRVVGGSRSLLYSYFIISDYITVEWISPIWVQRPPFVYCCHKALTCDMKITPSYFISHYRQHYHHNHDIITVINSTITINITTSVTNFIATNITTGITRLKWFTQQNSKWEALCLYYKSQYFQV